VVIFLSFANHSIYWDFLNIKLKKPIVMFFKRCYYWGRERNIAVCKIQILQADITELKVGAIVNAANNSLLGGGGVDGAIHRAAGPRLLEECRKLNGCRTGEAKITKGYNLYAEWIIHTVGPVWRGGDSGETQLLASCYQNSLAIARSYSIRTLAFPSISTGAYRFPVQLASKIAIKEIHQFLMEADFPEKIIIACFDNATFQYYSRELERYSLATNK
jgi:Predicted phosphatase homologous to the C-terminal domain of histone macroH2A1